MPEYQFKSIYFPKDRVRSNESTTVNLSLPAEPKDGTPMEFIAYLKKLNSMQFRLVLGDPYLEDLEKRAKDESRSLSNICVSILKDQFLRVHAQTHGSELQKTFNFGHEQIVTDNVVTIDAETSLGLTFRDSLRQGVYGWYPYLEGFSATYARDALLRDTKKPKSVFDPFGGAGTTQLAASLLGIKSFYSELNPFMSFVAETKVASASWARHNYSSFESTARDVISKISPTNLLTASKGVDLSGYREAFPERDFFEEKHIRELLAALQYCKGALGNDSHVERILTLACAANAVACSNMTRRADLRRRRPDEYKNRVVNVSSMVSKTIEKMLQDVLLLPFNMADTTKISADAKSIPVEYKNAFDLVLTSPPYLNGTNYFRNTKIELWLMSFITSEKELRQYRDLAVTGGINDVSEKTTYRKFLPVEKVACQLDIQSKDRRIPTMVRHYFSDMFEVIEGIYRSLVPGGRFLLDIGDSKFYGVHVPTDTLLIQVATEAGFLLKDRHILARRMSRDKSELVQVELVLEKPRKAKARS